MTVGEVQDLLESLYAVETGLAVDDYLVGEGTRALLPGALDGVPEQLFVVDHGDEIDLALFVDPEVLATMARHPPRQRLHQPNFEAFCIALEGVSHFITLAWRAQRERPVSGLELEVQAEVDKFLASWFLLAEQGTCLRRSAGVLVERLFVRASIRDEVPLDERARYVSATRIARDFCRAVSQAPAVTEALEMARTFFRVGLSEKAAPSW
ncbi:MAG: hypothetical protein AAF654_09450 [Myxococcota bacterium]